MDARSLLVKLVNVVNEKEVKLNGEEKKTHYSTYIYMFEKETH